MGSLSTIQLETERHLVEIFGSRSSVGVDHQYMREPKGGQNIPKLVQSLRIDGISIWCFDGLFSDTFLLLTKYKVWSSQLGLKATIYL